MPQAQGSRTEGTSWEPTTRLASHAISTTSDDYFRVINFPASTGLSGMVTSNPGHLFSTYKQLLRTAMDNCNRVDLHCCTRQHRLRVFLTLINYRRYSIKCDYFSYLMADHISPLCFFASLLWMSAPLLESTCFTCLGRELTNQPTKPVNNSLGPCLDWWQSNWKDFNQCVASECCPINYFEKWNKFLFITIILNAGLSYGGSLANSIIST